MRRTLPLTLKPRCALALCLSIPNFLHHTRSELLLEILLSFRCVCSFCFHTSLCDSLFALRMPCSMLHFPLVITPALHLILSISSFMLVWRVLCRVMVKAEQFSFGQD